MILILSDVKYDFNTESFEFETVNDETVLYFKDIKKALVLNNTCSVIWTMIAKAQKENSGLSDEAIADHLINMFHLPNEMRERVKKDIYELFQNFLSENIIHMNVITEDNKGVCV